MQYSKNIIGIAQKIVYYVREKYTYLIVIYVRRFACFEMQAREE